MPDPKKRTPGNGGSGRAEKPEQSGRSKRASPAKALPKPSSAKLEAAETALEAVSIHYEPRLKALADHEAKLARERRELEEEQCENTGAAKAAVEAERRAYDDAMRQWQNAKSTS